jgi:plasmid replication initiation protein
MVTEPQIFLDNIMAIDTELIVQKVRQSNHLVESPYSQDFTSHEIKLFEIAAAGIYEEDLENAKNKINKRFSFSSKQLAELLNTSVSTISHEIENTARRLIKKTIHLREVQNDSSVEFVLINIIPYARYKSGVFEYDLNYAIIPYLIEINKNFTEYKLKNLLILNSAYAIKLYKLLYQYKNIKHRTFSVDDLKEQLGIIDKYPLYKNLKQKIIEPSVSQINILTDLSVEYSEKKLGRKVDRIEFSFIVKNKFKQESVIDILPNVVNNDFINSILDDYADKITSKSKEILTTTLQNKGETFIIASVDYAKKNAKTNFEKYLLDTIENNWAEQNINKLEIKKKNEKTAKQKVILELDNKAHQKQLENANKSEIENLFLKLNEIEQIKYNQFAQDILFKNFAKLEKLNCSEKLLTYSMFAISIDKHYNKTLEIYIEKILKINLHINR